MKRIKKLVHVARLVDHEEGMTTAEYAVGTVAACGFGGLLLNLRHQRHRAQPVGRRHPSCF